ncbi:hypothetical protein BD410DRAFT_798205 [Rickenella mellea]|uniref:Up-regulated during septation protein 1 domain-containing protein n=1 Tax=Rickenella mellea TaxID=50990 RepID=A0A4R5XEW1_9AGAM|nr:hypothetical protein BD410DRAFT_798205 [Rickenella mellea]
MSPIRRPVPNGMDTSSPSSIAGPSSPMSLNTDRPVELSRKTVGMLDATWKRTSNFVDTRDEMLMSLLASEAVVDSRESEILSAEEVDALKKEQQVLSSRVIAASKKLTLETKIRDAAVSLSRVNAANKGMSKQTSEQLDVANRKIEAAQKEFWRLSERANEIQRRLLEHRAGVLSASVQTLEAKVSGETDESGFTTPFKNSDMSPTSSITSASISSRAKFSGPHLFAGHAGATPPSSRKPLSAPEVAVLEEKLKEVTGKLESSTKIQAEMRRELSALKLEKGQVETSLGTELQTMNETLATMKSKIRGFDDLQGQLETLLEEKSEWQRERRELDDKRRQVEMLERRLEVMEEKSGQAVGMEALLKQVKEEGQAEVERRDRQIWELKAEQESERTAWGKQRATMETETLASVSTLQRELERLRSQGNDSSRQAESELQIGLAALQNLMQAHGVVHSSKDASIRGLAASLGLYMETVASKLEGFSRESIEWEGRRRALEGEIRAGLDKREALNRELEDARREREDSRKEVRSLETRIRDQSDRFSDLVSLKSPPMPAVDSSADKVTALLRPIWLSLPSPEARASKFGARNVKSPTVTPGSPNMTATSLSDLDVRSLKTLYDNRPNVPQPENPGAFTLEGFASRVQALVADDRALIERLIRFAQAHDLLKKNAERAQKLAQESSLALETYQKQVKALEERNMTFASGQAMLQDEVDALQETVDRILVEKRNLEKQIAEQAETNRQLSEANNTLSAKALTLAAEAAAAPEALKKQLEKDLAECKMALEKAQEELDAMRSAEQSQRVALLDELNSMQTENGNLRAQLRAAGKK